jgi:hypothetical protein
VPHPTEKAPQRQDMFGPNAGIWVSPGFFYATYFMGCIKYILFINILLQYKSNIKKFMPLTLAECARGHHTLVHQVTYAG